MKRSLTVLILALAVLVNLGFSDVRMEMLTRISLVSGLGNAETNSKTEYQGEKLYEIANTRMVGGIMGAVAGGYRNTAKTTRLDKDLIWNINHGNKTYTENPLQVPSIEVPEEVEDRTESVAIKSRGKYEVIESEISVEETGNAKDINGFPCEEYLLTYRLVLRNKEKGDTLGQEMTVDFWLTPVTEVLTQAQKEKGEFNQKMLEKLGLEVSPQQMEQLGLNMITIMYGVDSDDAQEKLEEVAEELAKLEGYPIVTEVKWRLEAKEAEPEPEPEPVEKKPSFPTSLGGLRSALKKQVTKEIVKQIPEPKLPEFLFTSYIEVKSVAVDELPASDFEVPEGYTRVK